MKHLAAIFLLLAAAAAYGQTVKSLGYNTNGQVIYTGTNALRFTNNFSFSDESAASLRAATGTVWQVKTTNLTNSSTNLMTGFSFTTSPNKKYAVELFVVSLGGGMIGKITATNSTVVGNWSENNQSIGTVPSASVTSENQIIVQETESLAAVFKFVVLAGTNSGDVIFDFKSDLEAVLGAGSYLKTEVIQ